MYYDSAHTAVAETHPLRPRWTVRSRRLRSLASTETLCPADPEDAVGPCRRTSQLQRRRRTAGGHSLSARGHAGSSAAGHLARLRPQVCGAVERERAHCVTSLNYFSALVNGKKSPKRQLEAHAEQSEPTGGAPKQQSGAPFLGFGADVATVGLTAPSGNRRSRPVSRS
jgi:hypothetical protein